MIALLARLRYSEWMLVLFFGYVALIVPLFGDRPHLGSQPYLVVAAVLAVFLTLTVAARTRFAYIAGVVRDWMPIAMTLVAFREMEFFLPLRFDHLYERSWIRLDHLILFDWHARAAIESLGPLLPFFLELCYLLVYCLAVSCVAILYARNRRSKVDRFMIIYLAGSLTAYALFPYFPSEPPRVAFPKIDGPQIVTWARTLNLFILDRATIHVGVFPSAHVSSAFSAAWAMFLLIPERKAFGWAIFLYAASVSVATVYGRYHYTADVLAGFAVSLFAVLAYLLLRPFIRDLPIAGHPHNRSR